MIVYLFLPWLWFFTGKHRWTLGPVFYERFGMEFVLKLPPVTNDVVEQIVSVKVGDFLPFTMTLTPNVDVTEPIVGVEGDTVTGSVVHVDAAGNESEPSSFSFVLVDAIPPPKPGPVQISYVG